jgi:hypothetical protein
MTRYNNNKKKNPKKDKKKKKVSSLSESEAAVRKDEAKKKTSSSSSFARAIEAVVSKFPRDYDYDVSDLITGHETVTLAKEATTGKDETLLDQFYRDSLDIDTDAEAKLALITANATLALITEKNKTKKTSSSSSSSSSESGNVDERVAELNSGVLLGNKVSDEEFINQGLAKIACVDETGIHTIYNTEVEVEAVTAEEGEEEDDDEDQNATPALLCYHGSTAENISEACDWFYGTMETNMSEVSDFIRVIDACYEKDIEMDDTLKIFDPKFGTFLFAVATKIMKELNFLKWCESEVYSNDPDRKCLEIIVSLGIDVRYHWIPMMAIEEDVNNPGSVYYRKREKYKIDIKTNRGMINVLARETKSVCDCMKPERSKTKTMEKFSFCYNCLNKFPKNQLLLCGGCLGVHLCSKDCHNQRWPSHKIGCEKLDFTRCDDCTILFPKKQLMCSGDVGRDVQYCCVECQIETVSQTTTSSTSNANATAAPDTPGSY